MPCQNRVEPSGDLHAVAARGLFTGNRGCLVGDDGRVVRHHQGRRWIICQTEFKGWRSPLTRSHHWTPIFFLDDSVALAAGHRPCALCRRADFVSYRNALTADLEADRPLRADEIDRRLAGERLSPGRGVNRAAHRPTWGSVIDDLPVGSVLAGPVPVLVLADRLMDFTFEGWTAPAERPRGLWVNVLTPPTSIRSLARGYQPVLHSSAMA